MPWYVEIVKSLYLQEDRSLLAVVAIKLIISSALKARFTRHIGEL